MPPRKRATGSSVQVPVRMDGENPLVLTSTRPEDVEKVVAFVLDDVEYLVPKTVSRGWVVRMMRLSKELGFEAAMYEGMTEFYGEEAMEKLEDADLSEEMWDALQKIFVRTVYGDDAVKNIEKEIRQQQRGKARR